VDVDIFDEVDSIIRYTRCEKTRDELLDIYSLYRDQPLELLIAYMLVFDYTREEIAEYFVAPPAWLESKLRRMAPHFREVPFC
jgi:hypothetical protein